MSIVKTLRSFRLNDGTSLLSCKLLVAVSGGKDSMVLLHALQSLDAQFSVAHMNYQLRGEDSLLDQKQVVDYCKANDIECHVKAVSLDPKSGVQAKARELRYSWFKELLSQENLDLIVTAHHLSDQVETVMFNLARGSGIAGVGGMIGETGRVIRPLLHTEKSRIDEYQQSFNVPVRKDVSNDSLKYSRNRLRHQVVPVLKELNSQSEKHVSEFADQLQLINSFLQKEAKEFWESNSNKVERGCEISLSSFRDLNQQTVLWPYILELLNEEKALANELLILSSRSSGKRLIGVNWVVFKDRDKFIFTPLLDSKAAELTPLSLTTAGVYSYGNHTLELRKVSPSATRDYQTSIYLPLQFTVWPLTLRPWKDGDRFIPFGMKGVKKISDFLIQEKTPLVRKREVLVLEMQGKIIWVVGMRASEETRVSPSYKQELLEVSCLRSGETIK